MQIVETFRKKFQPIQVVNLDKISNRKRNSSIYSSKNSIRAWQQSACKLCYICTE